MVVAQLVKWSLLTPEVRGSNPVNGKLYITYLLSIVLNRQKENHNRGRDWPNLKMKVMMIRDIGKNISIQCSIVLLDLYILPFYLMPPTLEPDLHSDSLFDSLVQLNLSFLTFVNIAVPMRLEDASTSCC